MSDITKCRGENCQIRNQCYRYTAPEDIYFQNWESFEPTDGELCSYFWNSAEFLTDEEDFHESLSDATK